MLSEVTNPIDAKILGLLLRDCRTNIKVIAKECGISSSAVFARIKNLKKSGVIVGTRLIVRHCFLDYPYEVTVSVTAETQRIEEIAQVIRAQPNVMVCTKTIGRYNLFCLIVARNTTEIDWQTQKIKNISGVLGTAINLWVDEPFNKDLNNGRFVEKPKLGEIDRKIIDELMTDCRMPCTKIAQKLGVANETVRYKIKEMRQNGVIRACTITVDWSKFGYQGTLFALISINPSSDIFSIISKLLSIPRFFVVQKVMGPYDIFALSEVKDLKDLARIVHSVQDIPGIRQIDISIASFTYFSYNPVPKTSIQSNDSEIY